LRVGTAFPLVMIFPISRDILCLEAQLQNYPLIWQNRGVWQQLVSLIFQWKIPFIPAEILRDLESKSSDDRISAVRKLGAAMTQEGFTDVAFTKIVEVISSEREEFNVRCEAIEALKNRRHPNTLEFLINLMFESRFEKIGFDDQSTILFKITNVMQELNSLDAVVPLLDYFNNYACDELSQTIIITTLQELINLVPPDDELVIEKLITLKNNPEIDQRFGSTLDDFLVQIISK